MSPIVVGRACAVPLDEGRGRVRKSAMLNESELGGGLGDGRGGRLDYASL